MKLVVNKEYWDKHWQKVDFDIAPKNHPVRKWIEKNIASTKDDNCLEIGCYPGKFLAVFGEKGYVLNGIDLFNGTESLLPNWLKKKGYKIGSFYESDFFNFKNDNLYDVVFSFGFIEHFKDWQGILRKHIEFTKTGGKIIVEVPNLKSPLYYFLYWLFEPNVLKNHELEVINLKKIKNFLEEEGCEIKLAEYIGHFYFRFVTKNSKMTIFITRLINSLKPIFCLLPIYIQARYLGVIAVKK